MATGAIRYWRTPTHVGASVTVANDNGKTREYTVMLPRTPEIEALTIVQVRELLRLEVVRIRTAQQPQVFEALPGGGSVTV